MSESKFPWRTLLFVSLAVNLLVIGAIAGAVGAGVRLQREAPEVVVARMPGPRAFLQALPEGMRPRMRQALAESWRETRDARRAAIEARRQAFVAAAAEPYDAARVRTAFERVRAADQAAIAVFHNRVIDALGELTPEERAAALDALARAAPAQRANGVGPEAIEGGPLPDRPALDPEQRQQLREQRREKMRERVQQWRERQQQEPQPAP